MYALEMLYIIPTNVPYIQRGNNDDIDIEGWSEMGNE